MLAVIPVHRRRRVVADGCVARVFDDADDVDRRRVRAAERSKPELAADSVLGAEQLAGQRAIDHGRRRAALVAGLKSSSAHDANAHRREETLVDGQIPRLMTALEGPGFGGALRRTGLLRPRGDADAGRVADEPMAGERRAGHAGRRPRALEDGRVQVHHANAVVSVQRGIDSKQQQVAGCEPEVDALQVSHRPNE